eukprot:8113491-Alexandrium_andersonii.AAC.1
MSAKELAVSEGGEGKHEGEGRPKQGGHTSARKAVDVYARARVRVRLCARARVRVRAKACTRAR